MKIEINIDESCKNCKKSLKYFKELQKQNKEVYMNLNMKKHFFIDGLHLVPDFNCSGYLTHFHINRADKDYLKFAISMIEQMEKEGKIIQNLKKGLNNHD